MEKRKIEYTIVDINSVETHPKNVRQGDIGAISESLKAHGQYRPIVVDKRTNRILAGNDEALRILLADNRTTDLASYDNDGLEELLKELASSDKGLEGTLFDGDDLDSLISDNSYFENNAETSDGFATNTFTGTIAKRFGIAPFSILDCRRSWWRDRREVWLKLGISSEIGRNENLLKMSDTILNEMVLPEQRIHI